MINHLYMYTYIHQLLILESYVSSFEVNVNRLENNN